MPKRIQRRRIKGWKMPPGAVYVGRPTKWGNPFTTAAEYRDWLTGPQSGLARWERDRVLSRLGELLDKDLACWCELADECHADVLLELVSRNHGIEIDGQVWAIPCGNLMMVKSQEQDR